MAILTRPSSAPSTALTYITIGAILTVVTGTSFFFFNAEGSGHTILGYLRTTLLILGIVFLVIGFTVGQIARAARHAELPPSEATPVVAQADQMAAARGAAPTAPNGQPGAVPGVGAAVSATTAQTGPTA